MGEYIQYPKIAKDFANYLELYYKYRDDYQIDEILSGTIRESLCNKLSRAPFDEKLNVMGLLLSRLSQHFKKVADQGDRTGLLMEELKKVDPETDGNTSTSMVERLRDVRSQWSESVKQKREAGLLNRREDFLYRDVEAMLLNIEETIKKSSKNNMEEDWKQIRERFQKETERYDMFFSESGKSLEHAFDFLEASFAAGQEMVLFITELNTGFYSMKFLKEYECERYYQYNKSLLFKDREDEIRSRITSLGK